MFLLVEFYSADIIDYILEKSVSCQKKDVHDHARPSFFWYDNDKDLKVCFLVTHIMYKKHTSTIWFLTLDIEHTTCCYIIN